jgi:hypothetical protein
VMDALNGLHLVDPFLELREVDVDAVTLNSRLDSNLICTQPNGTRKSTDTSMDY